MGASKLVSVLGSKGAGVDNKRLEGSPLWHWKKDVQVSHCLNWHVASVRSAKTRKNSMHSPRASHPRRSPKASMPCSFSPQQPSRTPLALLLADTNGPTPPAGRLAVLATDAQAPVVTETTVGADLLQALQVLTELAVHTVGHDLVVLAVDDVALSVQEPGGDLVLSRVLDDGDDALEFFGGKLASAAGGILVLSLGDVGDHRVEAYRLLRSTSAFLQTKLL